MPPRLTPLTTYQEMVEPVSVRAQLRDLARSGAIFALSRLGDVPRRSGWIRFPQYHHVFDDERAGFAAHLAYMKNLGDFVTMDDAIEHLNAPTPPRGRYFCLTFDDGYLNCATNATPILLDHKATAAFFLPTAYIRPGGGADDSHVPTFSENGRTVECLSWDDCRSMLAAGMTLGSHTVNHARLIDLSSADVERELRESKETIERELGSPCYHFCCPWGRTGTDFTRDREPEIARRLGYRSFLATDRGTARARPDPMAVTRDHLLANCGLYQLRYFFSR